MHYQRSFNISNDTNMHCKESWPGGKLVTRVVAKALSRMTYLLGTLIVYALFVRPSRTKIETLHADTLMEHAYQSVYPTS